MFGVAGPATGEVPTLSAPQFMQAGLSGLFPFFPPAAAGPPPPSSTVSQASCAQSPQHSMTRTSLLPETQTALSSEALPRPERSFDIRNSETFYGDMPATQPQNLGQGPGLRNSETFLADPAPAISAASPDARGSQPVQQAGPEYRGYSAPSRLQGVPMRAAKGVFAPAPATTGDSVEALVNAKVKARELQFQLKLEMKHIEREARKLSAEEAKLQQKMRAQAERGKSHEAQLLARNVVQTRKAVERLEQLKASMHGIVLQLTESMAAMSMKSCLKLSTDAMRQMGEFSRIPELEAAVQRMRLEAAPYMHAEGCVDEALRDREVEEASAAEVQRLLEEVALDRQLAFMATAGSDSTALRTAETVPQTVPRTVPQTVLRTAPQTIPLTRLPSMASTVLPSDWQLDQFTS